VCLCEFGHVYIRAMPQLASYLRAIGCRATISSDRITARLGNGPGLPDPRCTFLPLFLNFPDTPLVSVTTITLIIALRRYLPYRRVYQVAAVASGISTSELRTRM